MLHIAGSVHSAFARRLQRVASPEGSKRVGFTNTCASLSASGPPGDASHCAPDRQLPPSRTVPVSPIRPASMRPRGERSTWSHAPPQPLDRSGLARRAPASHPSPCFSLPALTGHSYPPKHRNLGVMDQASYVSRRRRAAVLLGTRQFANTKREVFSRGDPSDNCAASARDRRSFDCTRFPTSCRVGRSDHRRRYERVLR